MEPQLWVMWLRRLGKLLNSLVVRGKSHIRNLMFLGLTDYLRFAFLKHLNPPQAYKIYFTHLCDDPLLKSVRYRRDVVRSRGGGVRNYQVIVGMGRYATLNIVRGKDLIKYLDMCFIGTLEELFIHKLYSTDWLNPSRYDCLIDVGSTYGEVSLYYMSRGFKGYVVTVEPFVDTWICVNGEPYREHRHYMTYISRPEDFKRVTSEAYGRVLMKVDCEGCEAYLKPQHLVHFSKDSLLILEVHDKELLNKQVKEIESIGYEKVLQLEYRGVDLIWFVMK